MKAPLRGRDSVSLLQSTEWGDYENMKYLLNTAGMTFPFPIVTQSK